MRGNTSRYPDKALTQQQAESQLLMYLINVRPERRASITVDSILAMYRVPRKVAEYRLTIAQQRWATE